MKDETFKEFEAELDVLLNKYGIKHAAFAGTSPEGDFLGLACGKPKYAEGFEIALNVGRLWQHMRSTVRDTLATYDRWSTTGK
jgi:hypothetical protein